MWDRFKADIRRRISEIKANTKLELDLNFDYDKVFFKKLGFIREGKNVILRKLILIGGDYWLSYSKAIVSKTIPRVAECINFSSFFIEANMLTYLLQLGRSLKHVIFYDCTFESWDEFFEGTSNLEVLEFRSCYFVKNGLKKHLDTVEYCKILDIIWNSEIRYSLQKIRLENCKITKNVEKYWRKNKKLNVIVEIETNDITMMPQNSLEEQSVFCIPE